MRLSPSGRWLAVSTAAGSSRVNVAVFDMQSMQPVAIPVRYVDADIGHVDWVNDDTLVFSIQDNQSDGVDQRYWSGLFAVSRDGQGGVRQLVGIDDRRITEIRVAARRPLPVNHELLHVPAGNGQVVIVGEYVSGSPGKAAEVLAKQLDISSGRVTSLVLGVPPNFRRWIFDAQGDPRLVTTGSGGREAYHWRENARF